MKLKKLSLLALFVVILSVFTGCQTQRGGETHTNFLGIYERQTSSYTAVPATTVDLRRADIDPGAEYTGNRVSLLWGLFTYYDY
jgi:hypothetical protein